MLKSYSSEAMSTEDFLREVVFKKKVPEYQQHQQPLYQKKGTMLHGGGQKQGVRGGSVSLLAQGQVLGKAQSQTYGQTQGQASAKTSGGNPSKAQQKSTAQQNNTSRNPWRMQCTTNAKGKLSDKTEGIAPHLLRWNYAYGKKGHLESVFCNGKVLETYEYNQQGQRLCDFTRFFGGKREFTYNYQGQLVSVARKMQGGQPEFQNEQERMQEFHNGQARTVEEDGTFESKKNGSFTHAQSRNDGDMHFTYDFKGSLQQKTTSAGTTNYMYGTATRLDAVQMPDGTAIRYEYNKTLLPSKIYVNDDFAGMYIWKNELQLQSYYDGENHKLYTFHYQEKTAQKKEQIMHNKEQSAQNKEQTVQYKEQIAQHKEQAMQYKEKITVARNPVGVTVSWVEQREGTVDDAAVQEIRRNLPLGSAGVSMAEIQLYREAEKTTPVEVTAKYSIATDQIGSIRAVFDVHNNVIKQITYDSFGNCVMDTNPDFFMPLGFAGGMVDICTGFVRFGFRDYDPAIGRFTSKDPLGDTGGDHDLYDYCVDDPVSFVDPEGLRARVWNEADHPRDRIGQFTYKGQGYGGKKAISATNKPYVLGDKTTNTIVQNNALEQQMPFDGVAQKNATAPLDTVLQKSATAPLDTVLRKNATAPRKESTHKIEIGQPVREVHGAQLNLAEETGTEYYVVGKRPLDGFLSKSYEEPEPFKGNYFGHRLDELFSEAYKKIIPFKGYYAEHQQFFKSDGSNVGFSKPDILGRYDLTFGENGEVVYTDAGKNLVAYEYARAEKYDAKYMDRAIAIKRQELEDHRVATMANNERRILEGDPDFIALYEPASPYLLLSNNCQDFINDVIQLADELAQKDGKALILK